MRFLLCKRQYKQKNSYTLYAQHRTVTPVNVRSTCMFHLLEASPKETIDDSTYWKYHQKKSLMMYAPNFIR